jgi:hypothetical protein
MGQARFGRHRPIWFMNSQAILSLWQLCLPLLPPGALRIAKITSRARKAACQLNSLNPMGPQLHEFSLQRGSLINSIWGSPGMLPGGGAPLGIGQVPSLDSGSH